MADIATIALAVDATQVKSATGELDRFSNSAAKAEAAATKVGASSKTQATAMQGASTATGQAAQQTEKLLSQQDKLSAFIAKTSGIQQAASGSASGMSALGGAVETATGSFAPLLSVVGVAGGALLALGAAVAYVIAKNEEIARANAQVQVGFASTGNSALLSSRDVKTYIDQLALLPGVSREAAEKSVTELSRVPYITGPLFDRSTRLLADFAAMSGDTVPKATAVLAQSLNDPFAAAQKLDGQFNLLTTSQRLQVEAFQATGDKAGALGVLLKALEDRSKGLADLGLTPVEKAANQVAVAWDGLSKSLGEPSGYTAAQDGLAGILKSSASLLDYLREHEGEIGTIVRGFVNIPRFAADPVGAIKNQLGIGSTTAFGINAGRGATGAFDSDIGGSVITATGTSQAGQSAQARALLDATKGYESQAAGQRKLIDQQKQLLALSKDTTLSTEARALALDRAAAIQERLDRAVKAPAVQPLGLNVDRARLDAQLRASALVADAEKQNLSDLAHYQELMHSAGLLSDKKYYASQIEIINDYSRIAEAKFREDLEVQQRLLAEVNAKRAQNPAQTNDIDTQRIKAESAIAEILAKQQMYREHMANDKSMLAQEEQLAARRKAYNDEIKATNVLQSNLTYSLESINVREQLGLTTSLEAMKARGSANGAAMKSYSDQIAILEKLRDIDAATNNPDGVYEKTRAIEGMRLEVLRLSADLDPLGKQLNGIFNDSLTSFFDKFANGGIKSFKDLKTAAGDFVLDLNKQLLHIANQELAQKISLILGGGQANGAGGILSGVLGAGGSSGRPGHGWGPDQNNGILGSLFGRAGTALNSYFNPTGLGSQSYAAGGSTFTFGTGAGAGATGAFDAGIFRYGGFTESPREIARVPASMFDNAPRLAMGGLLGYGATPAILHPGEEVLTADSPRNRKNGGGGSNPPVAPAMHFHFTEKPSTNTLNQVSSKAYMGARRAAAR